MDKSEVILYLVKLVLGGVGAFFAILLWARTKDYSWMAIVAFTITRYAGVVYDMMVKLGIIITNERTLLDIPISDWIFTGIPDCFLIFAIFFKLYRSRNVDR